MCMYRKTFSERVGAPSFPCGKCVQCRKKRVDAWAFRLQIHHEHSATYHSVTLTYESPPMTANNFMTLVKRDYQLFFKRLRKISTHGRKISYYLAAEYGGERSRPHAHVIIFNSTADDIIKAWQGYSYIQKVSDKRTHQVVNGHVYIDKRPFSTSAVAYLAHYTDKGVKVPIHKRDDRLPEFQLFSKGLGSDYLTDRMVRYHQADPSRLYYTKNGFKKGLPRYFRDKIYTDEDVKDQQRIMAVEKMNEAMAKKFEEHNSLGIDKPFYQAIEERKQATTDAFFKKNRKRKDF